MEVDSEAAEKLCVSRADFMHALEHDIKPAFGSAQELLEGMCSRYPCVRHQLLKFSIVR